MIAARSIFTALLLALLPLAAEATHQELPVHAHEEDLAEDHDGGKNPNLAG